LQEKVKYVIEIVAKFSKETTNLNALLVSKNCSFNKTGLGYKPIFQRKVKKYNNFFSYNEIKTSPFESYFYCLRKGNTIRNCRVKKYELANGLVRWT